MTQSSPTLTPTEAGIIKKILSKISEGATGISKDMKEQLKARVLAQIYAEIKRWKQCGWINEQVRPSGPALLGLCMDEWKKCIAQQR